MNDTDTNADNNIGEQLGLDLDLGLPEAAEQMELPADTDEHPEDVRDGVYMLVVRKDGENVTATPVLYSLGETGAAPLEDAPDDPDEFYRMVCDDMEHVMVMLADRTQAAVTEGAGKADVLMQLLSDMQEQPQELVHNMLACMIIEAALAEE